MLSTPHFEQSRDGYCLPACARMILAHYGHTYSEASLVRLLGTKRFGTPISNITRFRRRKFTVQFDSFSQHELCQAIDNNIPVLAQVWTMMLPYWTYNTNGSHVFVVVGYDEQYVYVNDPALSTAPQSLVWDAFLAAWAEFDETAALISPR